MTLFFVSAFPHQESDASTIMISEDMVFVGEKTLDSDTFLLVDYGTTLTINGAVSNFGFIQNYGVVMNNGVLNNFGTISNGGQILNNHIIENNGLINNLCRGNISGESITGLHYRDGCKIWKGMGDSERWNVPENWSPVGVPEKGDEVRIDNSDWSRESNVILDVNFINLSGIFIDEGDSLSVIHGAKLISRERSIIQNYGTVNLKNFGSIENTENSQIKNVGTMNNFSGDILNDASEIANFGTINNNFLSSMDNINGGIIDNTYGIINNTSKITTHCNSVIKNIEPTRIIGSESIISVPCTEQEILEDESSIVNMDYTCKEKLEDNLVYVTTDKEHYDAGDSIVITGCISDTTNSQALNLQIFDPENKIVNTSTIMPEANGLFHTEYIIDEKFGVDGRYSVTVEHGNYSSTKTFTVPEFGSLAMVILLVSIVAIMLLTLKSKIMMYNT